MNPTTIRDMTADDCPDCKWVSIMDPDSLTGEIDRREFRPCEKHKEKKEGLPYICRNVLTHRTYVDGNQYVCLEQECSPTNRPRRGQPKCTK